MTSWSPALRRNRGSARLKPELQHDIWTARRKTWLPTKGPTSMSLPRGPATARCRQDEARLDSLLAADPAGPALLRPLHDDARGIGLACWVRAGQGESGRPQAQYRFPAILQALPSIPPNSATEGGIARRFPERRRTENPLDNADPIAASQQRHAGLRVCAVAVRPRPVRRGGLAEANGAQETLHGPVQRRRIPPRRSVYLAGIITRWLTVNGPIPARGQGGKEGTVKLGLRVLELTFQSGVRVWLGGRISYVWQMGPTAAAFRTAR